MDLELFRGLTVFVTSYGPGLFLGWNHIVAVVAAVILACYEFLKHL